MAITLNPKQVSTMGMLLDEWKMESCVAHFGIGDDWATLYDIESKEEGKGHATKLLQAARQHYEAQGKKFGGSVALNPVMRHIYQKLGIQEYV